MLQVASVVVFHAVQLCGKDTTEHIVDNVGIVTRTSRLCGIEDGGFDTTLVMLAEDTSCVPYQPGEGERKGGREEKEREESGRKGERREGGTRETRESEEGWGEGRGERGGERENMIKCGYTEQVRQIDHMAVHGIRYARET